MDQKRIQHHTILDKITLTTEQIHHPPVKELPYCAPPRPAHQVPHQRVSDCVPHPTREQDQGDEKRLHLNRKQRMKNDPRAEKASLHYTLPIRKSIICCQQLFINNKLSHFSRRWRAALENTLLFTTLGTSRLVLKQNDATVENGHIFTRVII